MTFEPFFFFFGICAIISVSKGKVNFIIQPKIVKDESSKSASKGKKTQSSRDVASLAL